MISFFWILFSDNFIYTLSSNVDVLMRLQTYKGWFFITSTSIFLFYLINNEITKNNKIQHELVKARLKAEESDRLKTAFLSNISHEIRTPLNGILGFSDLLCEEKIEPESKKLYINQVNNNGQSLLKIINDIIEVSKIQQNILSVNMKDFELNDLIIAIQKKYATALNAKGLNLLIKNDSSRKSDTLHSDYDILITILSNLIDNAIKYTEKGNITIGYHITEKSIHLFVEDTGIGISKEDAHIIFRRFKETSMTKKSNDGFGLGLSISKGLAEALNGQIEVQSELGKGSRFTVAIPKH